MFKTIKKGNIGTPGKGDTKSGMVFLGRILILVPGLAKPASFAFGKEMDEAIEKDLGEQGPLVPLPEDPLPKVLSATKQTPFRRWRLEQQLFVG